LDTLLESLQKLKKHWNNHNNQNWS